MESALINKIKSLNTCESIKTKVLTRENDVEILFYKDDKFLEIVINSDQINVCYEIGKGTNYTTELDEYFNIGETENVFNLISEYLEKVNNK